MSEWSKFLEIQAELTFQSEWSMIRGLPLDEMASCLDVGTGAARFLSLIAARAPHLKCVGFDQQLLGGKAPIPDNVSLLKSSLQSFQGSPADLVFVRLVLQHLGNLSETFSKLEQLVFRTGWLVLIEAADGLRQMSPDVPSLFSAIHETRQGQRKRRSVDVTLAKAIETAIDDSQFKRVKSSVLLWEASSEYELDQVFDYYVLFIELLKEFDVSPYKLKRAGEELIKWRESSNCKAQLGRTIMILKRQDSTI